MKRSVKIFFSAAIVSALVLLFLGAVILVEYNTSKTGIEEVKTVFRISGDGIIVNDRNLPTNFGALLDIFKNNILKGIATVFLFL